MDYIPSWERAAYRKGIREGIKRGIKQGYERKIQQGYEHGIELGIGQVKREIAIKMLNKGCDIVEICEVTDLDREEVIKLSETEVTTH